MAAQCRARIRVAAARGVVVRYGSGQSAGS